MHSEDIILQWKDPSRRNKNSIDHPSGLGFQEMDEQQMSAITGGGHEVEPMSTHLCAGGVSALISFSASYLVTAVFCK